MVLVQEVREVILRHLKSAETAIEIGDFSKLASAGIRFSYLPELIKDAKWKRELYLAALILSATGSTVDKETLDEMEAGKKAALLKEFAETIRALEASINDDKPDQISDILKDIAMKYYTEIALQ